MKVNSANVNAVSLCPTERERRLKFHFLAVGRAGEGGRWMNLRGLLLLGFNATWI